mmetsp:Transcript_25694/g.37888  ORF Transcript_25694/g.37888 Transcript_25694/m.37888 type:complete len:118 (+) Transcript_25694:1320-1673(+)
MPIPVTTTRLMPGTSTAPSDIWSRDSLDFTRVETPSPRKAFEPPGTKAEVALETAPAKTTADTANFMIGFLIQQDKTLFPAWVGELLICTQREKLFSVARRLLNPEWMVLFFDRGIF